jgi:hypothetical protein
VRERTDGPLYFLLLTATHRTYRFLPTFIKEYYPKPGVCTPPIFQDRMDALVRQKFPHEYDPASGIVRTNRPMAVREQRVDLSTVGREDEHASYFADRNPGYLRGDYLVCVCDMAVENRTRLGQKFFALDDE